MQLNKCDNFEKEKKIQQGRGSNSRPHVQQLNAPTNRAKSSSCFCFVTIFYLKLVNYVYLGYALISYTLVFVVSLNFKDFVICLGLLQVVKYIKFIFEKKCFQVYMIVCMFQEQSSSFIYVNV